MRQHRSFCLPESEQASRQARQEPDGMTIEARDDGLSGSGTGWSNQGEAATHFGRESRAGGRGLSDAVEAEGLEQERMTRLVTGSAYSAEIPQPQRRS